MLMSKFNGWDQAGKLPNRQTIGSLFDLIYSYKLFTLYKHFKNKKNIPSYSFFTINGLPIKHI